MRSSVPLLMLVGVLVLLAGVVFTMQGIGVVGPVGSLMYDNPTWVYQGIATAVIGLLILAGALFLGRRKPAGVGPS